MAKICDSEITVTKNIFRIQFSHIDQSVKWQSVSCVLLFHINYDGEVRFQKVLNFQANIRSYPVNILLAWFKV